MEVYVEINNKKIKLLLQKKGKVVDSLNILDEKVLSEELLLGIDRLLRKNSLKTVDIKEIKVDSDQGNNFTTTRIAKSLANAWNWTRKVKK